MMLLEENMRRCAARVVVLGFSLAVVLSGGSTIQAQGQSVRLDMDSQSESGITGTATLTEVGNNRIRIEIRANNSGAGPQPAHIHRGTCAQLDPTPLFSLSPVANGASTTEIDGTFQVLGSGQHAIHMHRSQEELAIYVACADIRVAGQAGGGQAAGQPATLPRSGDAGSLAGMAAGLSGLGLSLVAAGYAVRRRARG
jgi:hypothetical protein